MDLLSGPSTNCSGMRNKLMISNFLKMIYQWSHTPSLNSPCGIRQPDLASACYNPRSYERSDSWSAPLLAAKSIHKRLFLSQNFPFSEYLNFLVRLSPFKSTTIMNFLMGLQTRRLLFIFFISFKNKSVVEEMEIEVSSLTRGKGWQSCVRSSHRLLLLMR